MTTCQSEEFYTVSHGQAFDYVDRVLIDAAVHDLYSKDQLGCGLQTIFNNSCSDLPLLYSVNSDEPRRLVGIANLVHLYTNYFERYCTGPAVWIGYDKTDGVMGYVCYMFWDVFVVYPGNSTPAMMAAALEVMKFALKSRNENCVVSAIHGLGHWSLEVPEVGGILEEWLRNPTTNNPEVVRYAEAAATGMIQ